MRMALLTVFLLMTANLAYADAYKDGLAAAKAGDFAVALQLWTPLAKGGDARAQYELGYLYVTGLGVKKNCATGIEWYGKAAKQGHAVAQHDLGYAYETGQCVPENFSKALYWYRQAVKGKYPPSFNNLAIMYDNGEGVNKDPVLAYMWWTLAMELGHPKAMGYRDAASKGMSSEDKTLALKKAKSCKKSKYRECD